MRTTPLSPVLITALLTLFTSIIKADEHSFGVGLGHLYNGIGFNYATRTENSLSYVSLGCLSFSKVIHSNRDCKQHPP